MRASGKTLAVTGGGNGIGRELVLELLNRGGRVAALDVSEPGLQETARLAGSASDRLSTHVVDITDREAVGALSSAIVASHGQIDGLINVNLYGTIHTTKAFLPHLLKRPEAHIVNVSSMGGFVPVPGQTMYGVTKAGVMLLTEGLHSELADTNVAVTVVFPGAVATNISKNSGVAAPGGADASTTSSKIRMTEPDAAARMILDGMERDAYRVMVGPDAKMMDRLTRLSPLRAATIIYKQMRELLPS